MEEMRQGTFDDFLNDCKHGVYNGEYEGIIWR